MKTLMMAFAFATVFSAAAQAGDCVIGVTRYACPGKEQESYSKCGGKQSCDAKTQTATAQECAAQALLACENKRYDITKYKLIRAKFNGKDVAGGMDFCDKDQGSYKVAQHFPYRNSKDCR